MNSSDYDIVICGAGPTGSALALLLARHAPDPARIALTGKQFHTDAPAALAKPIDPRTLAMNQGSRVLLEQLGAWPAHSASIETVHVSQRSEEHQSELQSLMRISYAVFCLKKKTNHTQ